MWGQRKREVEGELFHARSIAQKGENGMIRRVGWRNCRTSDRQMPQRQKAEMDEGVREDDPVSVKIG